MTNREYIDYLSVVGKMPANYKYYGFKELIDSNINMREFIEVSEGMFVDFDYMIKNLRDLYDIYSGDFKNINEFIKIMRSTLEVHLSYYGGNKAVLIRSFGIGFGRMLDAFNEFDNNENTLEKMKIAIKLRFHPNVVCCYGELYRPYYVGTTLFHLLDNTNNAIEFNIEAIIQENKDFKVLRSRNKDEYKDNWKILKRNFDKYDYVYVAENLTSDKFSEYLDYLRS